MALDQRQLADYMRRMRQQGMNINAAPITMESQIAGQGMNINAAPITMESQIAEQVNAPVSAGMVSGYAAQGREAEMRKRAQDFSGEERAIEAQMAMAQQLRGREAPKGRTVGPYDVYVGPNWGESVAGLTNSIGGGLMQRSANKKDIALDEKRTEARLSKSMEEQDRYNTGQAIKTAEFDRLVRRDAVEDKLNEEEVLRKKQQDKISNALDAKEPKEYQEFTNGDTTIRGYVQGGIGFDEKGNPMPEGYYEKYEPRGSGLGGRDYITKITDQSGNEILTRVNPYDQDSEPEFLMVSENGENVWTSDRAAAAASVTATTVANAAVEKETGVAGVKSNQARIDTLNEQIPTVQKQVGAYFEAIQAITEGANTGAIAGRFPSFTDASTWLDNIQQELGLAKIGEYTFGSLSTAEGDWVKESAIPQNMSEEFLAEFLLRKAEGAKRLLKARQFERAYREEFHERPKDGMVDKILYEGGFTYGVPDEWLKDAEK